MCSNSTKKTASLFLLLLLPTIKIFAQNHAAHQLFLKNRTITLPGGFPETTVSANARLHLSPGQKTLHIIQFNEIPDQPQQMQLKQAGIELLDYIPDNAYTATITSPVNAAVLKKAGAKSVYKPAIEDIVDADLLAGKAPDHARTVAGKVDVTISFARSFEAEEVIRDLNQSGFELLSKDLIAYQLLDVRVPEKSIVQLAAFPWVQSVSPVMAQAEMLNNKSAANTRANVLGSSAILGYKLTGEGVVVGLGDESNPMLHADIGRRVISHVWLDKTWHGIHVGGTIAGSGLINERYRGYAPESKMVVRSRSYIWAEAPQLVRDYGMVVTSNTYPGPGGCSGFGEYMELSYAIDQQAFELPNLLHVFAAGNSGTEDNCNVKPVGFGTVLGQFQSAKNVLTVGNTQGNGVINPGSSKGPVADGRIKPEVAAPGTDIVSSIQNNAYRAGTGTSMSTPAVTGGAALLYQRYRQLYQQNNPKNALVKALICNGATDLGLPGPDYSYGFGQMNLLRSVTMLDKGHFIRGEAAHQERKTHEITVPANTVKLKVMIYWNDPGQSSLAGGNALVNNLDLSVIGPGNERSLPKFPALETPTVAAAAGVDQVNNIEQIVLEEPAAGTYTVQVDASRIPQGVQEYFVVYDIIEPTLIVTYPLAGDKLTKGDAVNISWDAFGDETSTFNVAYSLNEGTSWVTLNANVAATQRQLSWTVPDAATTNARVRVTRNGTDKNSSTGAFTILPIPIVTMQSAQCEGYIAIQWNALSAATDYEVMISNGDALKTVAFTNALKYTFSGLSADTTYYVSVRARKDQLPGRRSVSIVRKPDNGNCIGSISDNDLKMEAIVNPAPTVRKLTKAAYSTQQAITVSIRNLDDQPQTKPFEVGYALGGEMHWESVNLTLPPVATTNYTFQRKVDLSAVDEAELKVQVRLAGDPVNQNDILTIKLRQIPNPKLTLPYLQDFESIPALNVPVSSIGIKGAEAFDFTNVLNTSRMRSTMQPERGYSSNKALVLEGVEGNVLSQGNLDGTYNLSDYQVERDNVKLTFRHTASFSYYHDFNRAYIRGSSSDPWILAYVRDDGAFADIDNGYKLVSIEVSALLRKNKQEFSSDFQVRWGNEAYFAFPEDGYAIDDIRIFKTTSDIAITSLEAPSISSCDFGNPPMINAIFKNNGSDDCFKVPVKVAVDGKIAEHFIDVIRKNEIAVLKIYYTPEMFRSGKHTLKVWADQGGDINRTNDTLSATQTTTAAIAVTNSAYLEDFESGNGGWYTEGNNLSWQFGTPRSAGVQNAASGRNAWKTNLSGFYHNNETSYLNSPCLNINFYAATYLSFSARMDIEECGGGACDMLYVEWNIGYGWNRLGSKGYGTNWYNNQVNENGYWSGMDSGGWRVFTAQLPSSEYLRVRFVFKSNNSGTREGVTIDDIHIYQTDSYTGYDIYNEASVPNSFGPSSKPGNAWTPYTVNNKIVAAIHPRGQNIDDLKIKTFVNEGAVRESKNQMVLDRNFVIEPGKAFSQPVGVRLFVPDKDIQRLVTAANPQSLSKPASVYDLSISKYSGVNEDGNLGNNASETWDYFSQDKVRKVPWGSGYYLEFETKNFSEFWVARDYIGNGTPLPVELVRFTAEKTISEASSTVLLKWSTAMEKDFSHFVIQVAAGAENARKGLFEDLATVQGGGAAQQYSWVDAGSFTETRYYRLKMVDTDESFAYSALRSVGFNQPADWQVFPNPSPGIFKLERKGEIPGPFQIEIIDQNGRLRKKMNLLQAAPLTEIDLSEKDLASGLYLIRIKSTDGERRIKVVKQ